MADLTEATLAESLIELGRAAYPDDDHGRAVPTDGAVPIYDAVPPGGRRPVARLLVVAACVALVIGLAVVARREDGSAPPTITEPAGTVDALPAAPVAGRHDHVTARVGDVVVVWGGRATPPSNDASSEPDPMWGDGAAFDLVTETWHPIADAPLAARHSALSAVVDGRVAIVGGRATGTIFDDGALYDPVADTWMPLPDLPLCPGVLVGVADQLVALGRCTPDEPLGTAIYDPAEHRWREGAISSLATVTSAIAADGRLVAWDGGTDRLAVYDPATDRWDEPTGPRLRDPLDVIDQVTLIDAGDGSVVLVAAVTDADTTTTELLTWTAHEGWTRPRAIDGLLHPSFDATTAVRIDGRAVWATYVGVAWFDLDDGSVGVLADTDVDGPVIVRSHTVLVDATPRADVLVWSGVDRNAVRDDGVLISLP